MNEGSTSPAKPKAPVFFVVWCPTAGRPNIQHPERWSAEREAKRLAKMNPGKEFYVLRSVFMTAEAV